MKTLYSTCPTSSGSPSRPASFSRVFSQPVRATRPASRQASTAILWRGSFMRRGILSPGDPGTLPEARRAQRLESRDADPSARRVGLLLEDHAQPLERRLELAARPAAAAELLLEGFARGPRAPVEGDLHAGEAATLARELPDDLAAAAAVAAAVQLLPDAERALGLDDRRLDVVAVAGCGEQEACTGAQPGGTRVRQAEVVHEVVAPCGTRAEVHDEVEQVLARRGDEGVNADRDHRRPVMIRPRRAR